VDSATGEKVSYPAFKDSADMQAAHYFYRQFFVVERAMQQADATAVNTQTDESKAATAYNTAHHYNRTGSFQNTIVGV